MSLINNMLRDLDRRRKSDNFSPATVSLTPVADAIESRNFRLLILLVLGTVALAAILSYYFLRVYQQGERTEQLERRIIDNPTISAVSSEQAIPAQAEISNVSTPNEALVSVISTEPQSQAPETQVQPLTAEPSTTPSAVATQIGAAPEFSNTANTQNIRNEFVPQISSLPSSNRVAQAQASAETETPSIAASAHSGTSTSSGIAPNNATVVDPGNTGAGSAIVRNTTQISAQDRDRNNAQEALSLFNSNRTTAAFNMLSSYVEVNRDAHQSRETYAKLLINQNSNAEASFVIDSGLAIAPNHAAYKKIKARLLLANNHVDEAVSLLISRAPAVGSDPEYHDLLATAQLANRDFENAIVTYTSLLRQNNLEGKWWYGIGAAYDSSGDASSAIQAYNQALLSANLSAQLRQRSQRRVGELRQ
jgi:hypothetical protein